MSWESRALGPGLFEPLLLTCDIVTFNYLPYSDFWTVHVDIAPGGKDWVPNRVVKSGAGARGILGPQLRD